MEPFGMTQSLRKLEILGIARREGGVAVDQLASQFGVTTQTIRRDLSMLADEGKLDRVHGGAIIPAGASNIGYRERIVAHADSKQAIAQLCASRIPDNSSIFLNIGTTTEAVARQLLDHRNITAITNNINIARTLSDNPHCKVILTGGMLRNSDGGLVGDLAAQTISQFKVDFAVIGTSAIDEDGELLDYDLQEVRLSRAILQQSRRAFLVADSSKFQRHAPVRIASLSELDAIFTDSVPAPLRDRCREWETEIHLTS